MDVDHKQALKDLMDQMASLQAQVKTSGSSLAITPTPTYHVDEQPCIYFPDWGATGCIKYL